MKWHLIISFFFLFKHKNICIFIRNDYELFIILSNCNIPWYCTTSWSLIGTEITNSRSWRFQSVADAVRIVLFAHFYNTVCNVMSMVEIVRLRWRWIQRIDVVKVCRLRRRRRCLTTVHALLKLIDIQIIVVLLLLMMIMLVMAVGRSTIVGLCGPALWYSWSFCVRSIRRIIIG